VESGQWWVRRGRGVREAWSVVCAAWSVVGEVWSIVVEVDRPKYVGIGNDDNGSDRDTQKSCSTRCTQSQCLQRHPDRHEPIGADYIGDSTIETHVYSLSCHCFA